MGYELNPFTRKLDKVGTASGVGGGIAASLSGNTAGVMAVISTGTMYLIGGNNVTLSQNANSVTISGGAAGGADGINAFVVNGGASTASTTLALSNSNNVTFGINAGTITASASFNQTAQTQNLHNVSLSGNTAGVMAQISSGTMTLAGGNNVTLSQNGNAVTISGPNTVAQTQFVLSNSNGVSFGTNGSTVTASHNGLTSQSNQAVSAANGSSTFQTLSLANSNGVSFSTGTQGVFASHNGLTTQSAQAFSANDGGSSTFQTLFLRDGNGVSFSNSNGSFMASVFTDYAMTDDVVALINERSGTVSFDVASSLSLSQNGNTFSFGLASNITTALQSAGAYLTTARASNDAIGLNTAQSNVTWTANSSGLSIDARGYAGTGTTGTNATFTLNSNGLQLNAGAYLTTAMASNRGSDFVQANAAFAGTNASGTIASNGISVSVAAPGGGGVGIVAGTRTATTAGSLLFDNANGITFGLNGNGSSIMTASHNALTTAMASNRGTDFVQATAAFAGTNASGTIASNGISVSVAAPGAAAENNWVHALGANTAGNTTASGSTIGYSGINLTISGTNGSVMNLSVPATSSLSATGQVSISTNGSTISIGVPNAVTLSRYNEFKESPMVAGQQGNASLHIQPWLVPNLHMDRVVQHVQFSNATNSSNSFTISNWVGIYTRNVSTLSLLHSVSVSTNFSGSGTVGSYSLWGGVGYRGITAGLTQTLTEGMYWLGVLSRTSANAAGQTLNQMLNSNVNSTYSGLMGVATNATNQVTLGLGAYTASTSAMPASIAFTQINGASSIFLRPPSIYFVSGTI